MQFKSFWFLELVAAVLLSQMLGCGNSNRSSTGATGSGQAIPPLDPNTGSGSLSAPGPAAKKG